MEALEIAMNGQGRITIPSKLRKELNLKPDTPLVIVVENNKLIIQDRQALEQEMNTFFKVQKERLGLTDSNEVDRFIAERRLAASKE
jgi:AbrB family looped-hinge helix DNA binding protein